MNNRERVKYKAMGFTILRAVFVHKDQGYKIHYSTANGGWALWMSDAYKDRVFADRGLCEAEILRLEMNNPEKYMQD